MVSLKARRAFLRLKRTIRLQAAVRGHLVRRQAVATLYCIHGIVKLQANIRGQIARCSSIGCELITKQGLEKQVNYQTDFLKFIIPCAPIYVKVFERKT